MIIKINDRSIKAMTVLKTLNPVTVLKSKFYVLSFATVNLDSIFKCMTQDYIFFCHLINSRTSAVGHYLRHYLSNKPLSTPDYLDHLLFLLMPKTIKLIAQAN